MNFENMPEIKWRWGYLFALGPDGRGGRGHGAVVPPAQVAVAPAAPVSGR